MTIVKITVLETTLKKDLADEYAVPNRVVARTNGKSPTRGNGNVAGFASESLALSVRRCDVV